MKQIIISTLHFYIHQSTRIVITKFILIQEEIRMEIKLFIFIPHFHIPNMS